MKANLVASAAPLFSQVQSLTQPQGLGLLFPLLYYSVQLCICSSQLSCNLVQRLAGAEDDRT